MSSRRPFRERLVIWLALFLAAVVAFEGLKRLIRSLNGREEPPAAAPAEPMLGTLEVSEPHAAVESVARPNPPPRKRR